MSQRAWPKKRIKQAAHDFLDQVVISLPCHVPQFVYLKFHAMALPTFLFHGDIVKHKPKKPPAAQVTMRDRTFASFWRTS